MSLAEATHFVEQGSLEKPLIIGRVGRLKARRRLEAEAETGVIVRLADQENCPPVRSVETGEGFEDQD